MSTAFRPYLEHCFRSLFTAFRQEWVAMSLAMIDEERALIASDFAVKIPGANAGENFDAMMAERIEVDTSVLAPLLYRIQHAIYLREPDHTALPYLAQIMKLRTGMEIYYSTRIGPRFLVMHGIGAVIGPRHQIGSDFMVYQGATLGQRRFYQPHEHLIIGDHCTVFAGAKVFGNVRIGDHVDIGANSVLLSDAEPYSTYAGVPAVKVKSRSGGER